MHSLFEYKILTERVFYRSWYILEYMENHPNMEQLDKEAIQATIMDALVFEKLIDPNKQSLDIKNLCIRDNLDYYCYESHPFVMGIPLNIKEKMRTKAIKITGGIPLSVYYSKPAGPVSFCIYDMNTAFSVLFDNFKFLVCDYDSPTRNKARAEDRPFIEVEIDGVLYLVDALTKRIFRSDLFVKKYNLIIKDSIAKKEFNQKKEKYYLEDTTEFLNYGIFLHFAQNLPEDRLNSFSEFKYEIEQSKIYFPQSFEELEYIKKDFA